MSKAGSLWRLALVLAGLMFAGSVGLALARPAERYAPAAQEEGDQTGSAQAIELLAPATSPIVCRRATATVTIDGQLGDWAQIPAVYLDATTAQYIGGVSRGPQDISGNVRCVWDDQQLYISVDISDDILVVDSSTIWDDDGVEIALDGNRNRACCDSYDHQVTIAVDGRIADFSIVGSIPGVQSAVGIGSGGYAIEAAFPFYLFLPGIPVVGTTIGFDWGLNDDDDGGRRDKHLLWAGMSILNYPAFGDLQLVSSGGPAATPTATAQPAATATRTATPAAGTATPTATTSGTPAADRVAALEPMVSSLDHELQQILGVMQGAGYLPGNPPAGGTPTPTPTITVGGYAQRVACGSGTEYLDSLSKLWAADQPYAPGAWGYIGGVAGSTTQAIAGTLDGVLYQNERYNMISYQFDVPPGVYEVELRFAEIYQYAAVDRRIFDVLLEGSPVISGLDLMMLVGPYMAYNRTFETQVADGQLNVDFVAHKGAAKVSAIRVSGVAPIGPTPTPSLEQKVTNLENHMSSMENLLLDILATFDRFLGM